MCCVVLDCGLFELFCVLWVYCCFTWFVRLRVLLGLGCLVGCWCLNNDCMFVFYMLSTWFCCLILVDSLLWFSLFICFDYVAGLVVWICCGRCLRSSCDFIVWVNYIVLLWLFGGVVAPVCVLAWWLLCLTCIVFVMCLVWLWVCGGLCINFVSLFVVLWLTWLLCVALGGAVVVAVMPGYWFVVCFV